MTEQHSTEEVLKLVDKAQAKGVFDITEFAKGRAYPEDSVTAYLDVQSAYELSKLNEQMRSADPDTLAVLEKQAKELAEKVMQSKIVFHMRGVNQANIEKITIECDKKYPTSTDAFGQTVNSPEWIREWTAALIASNLVRIENANGEMDEREFTTEDVITLRHHLPKEVWDLLVEKMQQLTLAGAYFQGLTDAGFLPKS
jgi:hypothetical protein